jgi:hypothetical protein
MLLLSIDRAVAAVCRPCCCVCCCCVQTARLLLCADRAVVLLLCADRAVAAVRRPCCCCCVQTARLLLCAHRAVQSCTECSCHSELIIGHREMLGTCCPLTAQFLQPCNCRSLPTQQTATSHRSQTRHRLVQTPRSTTGPGRPGRTLLLWHNLEPASGGCVVRSTHRVGAPSGRCPEYVHQHLGGASNWGTQARPSGAPKQAAEAMPSSRGDARAAERACIPGG